MTRAGLLVAGALLLACDKAEPPTTSQPLAEASAPSTTVAASASVTPPPLPTEEKLVLATEGCGAVMPIPLRSAKSIGHTSVVFKLELESNQKLAWKPSSKRGKERWRGEVAASKLGDALAIPNVPPACLRTFTTAQLAPLLPKGALDEVIANEDGTINGAVIPWIEGLQFMALDKEPLRSKSKEWLSGGDGSKGKAPTDSGAGDAATAFGVPTEKMTLAAQLSTLLVFDAITGNWDRYSGGNVGLDATGNRVLFIDNDAAFMEGAPPKDLAANLARVESTQRFSRALVKRLRGLETSAGLAKALGILPGGRPLLPESILKTVAARITSILKVIDAKIAARTEDDVLYFP